MSRRRLIALSAGLLVTVTALPATASASASASASFASSTVKVSTATISTAAITPDSSRVATLVTGERVTLAGPADRQSVIVQPREGSTRHGYQTVRLHGDTYVIPVDAVPYLGDRLDLQLFDVSQLVKDGGADPAAATRFGTALSEQTRADVRAYRQPGTSALPAGLPKVTTTPRVEPRQPNFPMFPLQVTTVDRDGQPTRLGTLLVTNTDDQTRFGSYADLGGTQTRLSVPAGNYSALLWQPSFSPVTGEVDSLRMVTTEFSVDGPKWIQLDGRTATSAVSFSTPQPTSRDDLIINWYRGDATGAPGVETGYETSSGVGVSIAPSSAVSVGTLGYNVAASLGSPTGTATPYRYDALFPTDGAIPAQQSYRIDPGQVAEVDSTHYSDVPDQLESLARLDFLPYENFQTRVWQPLRVPVKVTGYIASPSTVPWLEGLELNNGSSLLLDQMRTYQPGERVAADWTRTPMAPGLLTETAADPVSRGCMVACRTGNSLFVGLSSMMDSTPGHVGFPEFPAPNTSYTTHFQLYQGDTRLSDYPTPVTGTQLTVPDAEADYRVVFDASRATPWTKLNTSSHTELTFRSGKTAVETALGALAASYRLNVGLDNHMPVGKASMGVTFAHAAGAPTPPISQATVEVSFDGGSTWLPTGLNDNGAGRYLASWTNPDSSAGAAPSLRVSAVDAAGATFSQTLTAAYAVSQRS